MNIAVFSIHPFEKEALEKAAGNRHTIQWLSERLSVETVSLAAGCEAVVVFTSDNLSAETLHALKEIGVKYIATRSTGHDHIDLSSTKALGFRVANVPSYSPYSIAEHAVGMMLALNRRLIESHERVKRYDFHIDGLTGFDLNGRTVGVVGTGNIGKALIGILQGFGCHILAYDIQPDADLETKYRLKYATLEELCRQSDIISLHLPLNENTRHLIDEEKIDWMKNNVMLINTSRGAVMKTTDVWHAVKNGRIGYLGLDVYEHEKGLFFEDHSFTDLEDALLAHMIAHPNVMITSHHAFLTTDALKNIAETTFDTLNRWSEGQNSEFELI